MPLRSLRCPPNLSISRHPLTVVAGVEEEPDEWSRPSIREEVQEMRLSLVINLVERIELGRSQKPPIICSLSPVYRGKMEIAIVVVSD
jgi:hypothetical protein